MFTPKISFSADDEQSDWFVGASPARGRSPNDECMGVPEIHSSAMSPMSSMTPTNDTSNDTPGPHCSAIKRHVPDSSDTENSQQSAAAADRHSLASWRVHRYFPRRGFGKVRRIRFFLNVILNVILQFFSNAPLKFLANQPIGIFEFTAAEDASIPRRFRRRRVSGGFSLCIFLRILITFLLNLLGILLNQDVYFLCLLYLGWIWVI